MISLAALAITSSERSISLGVSCKPRLCAGRREGLFKPRSAIPNQKTAPRTVSVAFLQRLSSASGGLHSTLYRSRACHAGEDWSSNRVSQGSQQHQHQHQHTQKEEGRGRGRRNGLGPHFRQSRRRRRSAQGHSTPDPPPPRREGAPIPVPWREDPAMPSPITASAATRRRGARAACRWRRTCSIGSS